VPIEKRGTKKIRVFVDKCPMPVGDVLVNNASGYKIISFLDWNAGYNQVFIAREDVHKTVFRCLGFIGLFEWVVVTFGLKNAGITYQCVMNFIFHDLLGLSLRYTSTT
jgi:hypothetical protein